MHHINKTIVAAMSRLVANKDSTTGRHLGRAARTLGVLIKGLLKLDLYTDELNMLDLNLIVESSQLHDIGKIAIHDDILLKRGKLTADEYELMKKHVEQGVKIIEDIHPGTHENEFLAYAREMIATHHEKWNGSGYPNNLAGEEIPLCGRLMAIADVYDALISERPYKKAFPHKTAIRIIEESGGIHFDPLIAEAFPEIISGAMHK